jgi:iron complex transport system ATP-binding protein
MPILQLKEIDFGYGKREVLKHLSFDVQQGEIIGIIGPNGSGKTTLLKVINGLLLPQHGEMLVRDGDIRQKSRRELAAIMAFVPQEFSLVFPFTVREIVMMGRYHHSGGLHFENGSDYLIVEEALALTDSLPFAGRSINELSGGERQRVLIARALAQQSEIMLLDEATAFLDIKHQLALFELITTLNKERGLTVLVVTHDINLAARYTDRVILLREGRVHSMGRAAEVITEKNIGEVYETNVLVDRNPRTGAPRVTL